MLADYDLPIEDPVITRLLHHALSTQILWVGLLAILFAAAIAVGRRHRSEVVPEARARTWLRWSFGALWLVDGILGHQSGLPIGVGSQVLGPATAGTPHPLHVVMNDLIGLWNRFPISLSAASMWIQLGLGLALVSSRGNWSRAAGAVSAAWALFVWVAADALGGTFSTGASVLFGWPGTAVVLAVAGLWLAVPTGTFERWFSPVTQRALSVLAGLAIIEQCWPDHEFWHGGPLNAVRHSTETLAQDAQPAGLADLVRGTGELAARIGGGFNLIVIFWLAACAVGLWLGARRPLRWPSRTLVTGSLILWVLVQDLGVFGGLATSVGSLAAIAALAFCASPARAGREALVVSAIPAPSRTSFAVLGAALGAAMIVVALVPMARSAASSGAETTDYIIQNGTVIYTHGGQPAPAFELTDQYGRPFSFPTHNGKYTVFTFLDPKCWTDCPLLSHQLEDLDAMLSPSERSHLQLVAIAADPFHEQVTDLQDFIRRNFLYRLHNFTYVTGPLPVMRRDWAAYHVTVEMLRNWRMSIHSDVVYVIGPSGRIEATVPDDPVSGWAGERSAAEMLYQVLGRIGLGS